MPLLPPPPATCASEVSQPCPLTALPLPLQEKNKTAELARQIAKDAKKEAKLERGTGKKKKKGGIEAMKAASKAGGAGGGWGGGGRRRNEYAPPDAERDKFRRVEARVDVRRSESEAVGARRSDLRALGAASAWRWRRSAAHGGCAARDSRVQADW